MVNSFCYPVICYYRHLFRIEQDAESLVITTRAGVKNGLFDNALVVDSRGTAILVKTARKVQGVGSFWGYNLFLNQRIKVDLVFDGAPFQMSVAEVRDRVLQSFGSWHGWQTRGDFEKLRTSVREAKTIAEIIKALA